jgi:hypothetical protein
MKKSAKGSSEPLTLFDEVDSHPFAGMTSHHVLSAFFTRSATKG